MKAPETPLISLDEAELARRQAGAEMARQAEVYTLANEAHEHAESDTFKDHDLLEEGLHIIQEEGSFDHHLKRIEQAEDDITGTTRVQKLIGRLLFRPQHRIDTTNAYNEYAQGIVARQKEARRQAQREKAFSAIDKSIAESYPSDEAEDDDDYKIARERLLAELRERFEPKKPGKLRSAAEKVRQNPKIRRIGKFVITDIPNFLGPSMPEPHEFLSDHYGHLQETLRQEEEAHANGTLTPAEQQVAKLRKLEQGWKARIAFVHDQPYIDSLYEMIGRETDRNKLLELYQAMGWLADDLRQAGVEGVGARVGSAFDPTTHKVVQTTGRGTHAVIESVERLGFRMTDGTLIRPANVAVRMHGNIPKPAAPTNKAASKTSKSGNLNHGTVVEVDHDKDDEGGAKIHDIDEEREKRERETEEKKKRHGNRRGGVKALSGKEQSSEVTEVTGTAEGETYLTEEEYWAGLSKPEHVKELKLRINQAVAEALLHYPINERTLTGNRFVRLQARTAEPIYKAYFGVDNLEDVPQSVFDRVTNLEEMPIEELDRLIEDSRR